MGAAGNCLSSCQFHSSTYSDVITALHFLPLQNSLFLRISLTTTLADALGLPRDCDCEPRLVGRGNLRESVGPGRLGYHGDVIAMSPNSSGRRSNLFVGSLRHALNQR